MSKSRQYLRRTILLTLKTKKMKASFKSIATTFKKLFAKEVKPANKKPAKSTK